MDPTVLPPFDEIPSLDSWRAKDGDLVRFRGMIQDMYNPEFYLETFEVVDKITKLSRVASGKYRDTSDVLESEVIDYNSPSLKSAERHTFRVIGVPALNEWARRDRRGPDSKPASGRLATKRPLLGDDERGVAKKRGDGEPAVERCESETEVALVKVYEEADRFKLNDTVEVVGYLSTDPEPVPQEGELDFESLKLHPSPGLVPRIHAVSVRKLRHCNPLLGDGVNQDLPPVKEVDETRLRLRKVLTEILLGDQLAADYVICHLISRIYIRRDVLTLGNFPLNLFGIPVRPESYTEKIYKIIEKIVTKSHYFPLTVDNLNDTTFVPVKDYDRNRLTGGLLQLSESTHLVLDETRMQPGKLNTAGIQNLSTLDKTMREQRVDYDFKFYRMEYSCDVPFLILSEGQSLLKAEFALPLISERSSLEIVDQIFEAADHYLNEEISDEIRTYLTRVRHSEYQISEEPLFVQEDFVAMRNEDEATEDDLHRLLVLTRLICLSRGFATLDRDCWNVAKDMEKQRMARLPVKKV